MIQVLALREFYSEKLKKMMKSEVWFDRGIRAPTVEDIFADPQSILQGKVTPSEAWNVYYTVADCDERPPDKSKKEKGRRLITQNHIPFDVDGIELPDRDLASDEVAPLELLAKVVCEAIGVKYTQCGVLFSGGGVQIIVGTTVTIESDDYFDINRVHYGAIADKIDLALAKAGLKGKADRSVWSPARLMRMPHTTNRKPDRPERTVRILNSTIERVDYDITKRSGLPTIEASEQLAETIVKAFPTPDVKAILDPKDGCRFLSWAQTEPEKVSEPEWYAAVSITSRFPEGRKFTHKMSEGHPGYSYHETELKIDQSIQSSGPRKCSNVNQISGGKCEKLGCKWWGTKLLSPILIEGPEHVKTSEMGFYNFYTNKETGEVKKGKPDYEGLARWFRRDHQYVAVEEGGSIWVWQGTHYVEMKRERVLQYAQDHFDPKPTDNIRTEFFKTLRLKSLVSSDWFATSVEGRMNFRNGVFDVKSGVLHPHSTDYGFRSVLPVDYSPDATAPNFESFIGQVTLYRPSLIAILQEFMGYIFANGDCKYQKMLILSGTGENGKSKFVDVIKLLASKDGFASLSIKGMQNDQNRVLMEGKLVNIAEENSRDSFRDVELIKNMVAGGEIQVKRLYAQPYQYENRTKLIALCNEMPLPQDVSHGFFRRLLIIPFDQVFSDAKGNRDPNILDKMQGELSGILNFAMEGYRRLDKENKFSHSAESELSLQEFKNDADSILAWATDYIEFDPDPEIFHPTAEMYNDYRSYCDSNGIRAHSAPKMLKFLSDFVKARGAKLVKRRTNHTPRVMVVNHIKPLLHSKF